MKKEHSKRRKRYSRVALVVVATVAVITVVVAVATISTPPDLIKLILWFLIDQERQIKSEMELRRKKEESEMLRQMEADRMAAEKLQAEINSENIKLQEQLEQERRDHELALRLAAENNSSVEDIQVWNTELNVTNIFWTTSVLKK